MSDLSYFLAGNVVKEEIVKYAASKRIIGKDKKPIEWELGCITSAEDQELRRSCTKKVQVPGKKNLFMPETDFDSYLAKLAVRCVKYPELNNAELQNSYGVMGESALLQIMLKAGEYQDLLKKIQEINGFDVGIDELVEEAKN